MRRWIYDPQAGSCNADSGAPRLCLCGVGQRGTVRMKVGMRLAVAHERSMVTSRSATGRRWDSGSSVPVLRYAHCLRLQPGYSVNQALCEMGRTPTSNSGSRAVGLPVGLTRFCSHNS